MAYNLRNLRILVIDDNAAMCKLLRVILSDLGFGTIDIAHGAEEGIKSFYAHHPDIVMVDWRLDRQDGIEFVKKIRQEESNPKQHVPIVMMTGYTNKERVFKARDAGITEFLIKPFTVQGLVDHLTNFIEKPRDFVISKNFTGPDRRRRREQVPSHARKRKEDILYDK
jgi:two-component system, chemotaxis family, chemotaxis protein CheY